MIVVSDTTAITTLLKAGEVELLEKLFGSVVIPRAVADELLAFHLQLPAFVVIQEVSEPDRLLPGIERLGKGETQAIQLAIEVDAEILVTDDRKARAAAGRRGHRPAFVRDLDGVAARLAGLTRQSARPIFLGLHFHV